MTGKSYGFFYVKTISFQRGKMKSMGINSPLVEDPACGERGRSGAEGVCLYNSFRTVSVTQE
jgi:hypothetical protein